MAERFECVVYGKKLREDAQLPKLMTGGSAACDLCAALAPKADGSDSGFGEEIVIEPGKTVLVPTGISAAIPQGFGGFIFARSGLGIKKGITPGNCVGVIDSDYRGEIMVGLYNRSDAAFVIRSGDRIAQMAVIPVVLQNWVEAEELDDTERGSGGFGSTGVGK
ncbi:MAG: dUTP diphosphatase [Oscillospiraceae bacterium]|nr:dUTP diphosphatase [Oscillospiraceae bacterium]